MDKHDTATLERPGGFEITERGIALCRFPGGAQIADIGCGGGQTLRYLKEKYGYQMVGVDIDPTRGSAIGNCHILTADGKKLPFADCTLDGLIFECSMSKMEPVDAVLKECARVIKPGGKLMVSDLYAREHTAQLQGRLGRLEGEETIESRSRSFGFLSLAFIDCSDSLQKMWVKLVFESGREALYDELGTDAHGLKQIRCGYYLAVYENTGEVQRILRD